ncbi:MAG: hypothetical protein WA510_26355 [Acidobacteriaceae bacterium]
MKDVFAVLYQREMDLERVRKEIEALRAVIPLLGEETPSVQAVADRFPLASADSDKWPLERRASTP